MASDPKKSDPVNKTIQSLYQDYKDAMSKIIKNMN